MISRSPLQPTHKLAFFHLNESKSWTKIGSIDALIPRWYFICVNVDIASNIIAIGINGDIIGSQTVQLSNDVSMSGITFQGNDEITNIQLFDASMNVSSIKCGTQGNLYSWSLVDWNIIGREGKPEITSDLKQVVCSVENHPRLLFIPALQLFSAAVQTCRRIADNGEIPDIVQNNLAIDYLAKAKRKISEILDYAIET